jgi:hypothetical protein
MTKQNFLDFEIEKHEPIIQTPIQKTRMALDKWYYCKQSQTGMLIPTL